MLMNIFAARNLVTLLRGLRYEGYLQLCIQNCSSFSGCRSTFQHGLGNCKSSRAMWQFLLSSTLEFLSQLA